MATITASLTPGHYPSGGTLRITFPSGALKAYITRGDVPPVLSEVLAYDNGPITPVPANPANPGPSVQRPFIAVTQDGLGNVTYDGGFPKFYNITYATNVSYDANGNMTNIDWPASLPTTLAGLTPASRYFYNVLNFIADPRKVGLGNRKILFVNNTNRDADYNILASHYHPDAAFPPALPKQAYGFRDTFDCICAIGNWTPTYYDCTSAGGVINLSFDYINQFAAVVFIGSNVLASPTTSFISEQFATNLAQYRRGGGGISIITDHCGDNYTDVNDAVARGTQYGADATKVAKYYGTYFSGNVDRQPVSVGTIRSQLGGDHPLFAGLSDSDMIFAAGSESLAQVDLHTADLVPADQVWTLAMNTAGTYRINILVQAADMSIVTRNLNYVAIDPSDINMVDSFNRGAGANGMETYKPVLDYKLVSATKSTTMSGKILVGGVLAAWFSSSKNGSSWNTTVYSLSGPGAPTLAGNGKQVTFALTEPFEYQVGAPIVIPDNTPYLAASGGLSSFLAKFMSHPFCVGLTQAQAIPDLTAFTTKYYPLAASLGNTINNEWWNVVGKGRCPFKATQDLFPIKVKIYATAAAWTSAKPAYANIGDAVIVAATNVVHYWDNASATWIQHPSTASSLYGVNRPAVNLIDNSNWVVGSSATTKV